VAYTSEAIAEDAEGPPSGGRVPLSALLWQSPDAVARALIVAVALAMTWLTWAHWGSIQVDCGRELYVPAQILRGKLLYRDLWYSYGPLEPYLAAALIGVFGQHFYVLYLFGLVLAIGSALLLFEIGVMLEGPMVGLAAALALLFQGFGPSIFNYVFPWSYAGSLGMLLSLVCAWLTIRHIVLDRRGYDLMLAACFASLALLCKQEFGAASYILLALVIAIEAIFQHSIRTLLCDSIVCAPAVALAVAVYGWFFWTLTPGFMVFDNWIGVPGTHFGRVGGPQLYAAVGLRFVPTELAGLALDGAAALFLWRLVGKLSRTISRRWFVATAALLAVGVVAARQFAPFAKALVLAVVFPPGMFFIGCGFLVYRLHKSSSGARRRALAEAGLSIFALALAVRVPAQIWPRGYSIFYDGPLFLVFIIALTRCVATAVPSLAIETQRALVNSLLAVEVVLLAVALVPGQSRRTAKLETSWGTIYLEPGEARVAGQILDFIEGQKRQGRRVVLLPELPMMYALTGTEAPSRWYTILPGYLSPAQEDEFIADMRRAAPAYIVLTNRRTSEYGAPYFGVKYDGAIYRWIEANYRVVGQFGSFRRGGDPALAALLYERRGLERVGAKNHFDCDQAKADVG
jgi:hypothetical protein